MTDKLLEVAYHQYIPHGVTGVMLDHKIDYVGKEIDRIIGIHEWSKNGDICLLTEGGSKPSLKSVKMRLRPISCLTKPITVPNYNQGKEFVPIVELAKEVSIDFELIKIDTKHTDLTTYHTCVFFDNNVETTLSYSENQSFFLMKDILIGHRVMSQSRLFDLMNQWLIDWRDLIGKGLAVPID